MYRPPENSNRVQSIKSKFENIDNSNCAKENFNSRNGTRSNLNNQKSDTKSSESSVLPLNLQRQLSDPSKRNIKRTPAFRLDKDKVAAFQRTSALNKSQELKHILKPVSIRKTTDCDKISNTSEVICVKKNVPSLSKDNKPILIKSKSSMDFNVLRNKFNTLNTDSNNSNDKESNQRNDNVVKNVSALYTEPIPKSLRSKTCDKTASKPIYSNLKELHVKSKLTDSSDIHNVNTLKLTDKQKSDVITPVSTARNGISMNNINGSPGNLGCAEKNEKGDIVKNDKDELTSALKKLDTLLQMTKSNSLKKTQTPKDGRQLELTDTLKNALKKPLPTGPAPKKPPRTFLHCSQSPSNSENEKGSFDNFEKNISFLHVSKHTDNEVREPLCLKEKTKLKRNDPKYMLNKLESALRNNRLKTKRTIKTDVSTTSGEDSDDSSFKNSLNKTVSDHDRTLPPVPDTSPRISSSNNSLVQALNFNCLNGNNYVTSPPYNKSNNSKSSFFVSVKKEEPVYAEPWQFEEMLKPNNFSRQRSISSDRNTKNNRNSLYYWSSPVLCSTPCSSSSSSMNISSKQTDVPSHNLKCRSEKESPTEFSSLSSFTSESASSTPMDDIEKPFPGTIKQLIETFESKTNIKKDEENDETYTNDNDINKDSNNKYEEPEKNAENSMAQIKNEDRISTLKNAIEKDMNDSLDFNESGSANKCDRSLPLDSEHTSMHSTERKMSTDDPTLDKFRTYVRNVSQYAKNRHQSKKCTLFECCLIVEWNADVGRIKFKYPHDVQVPHKIEDLCFPDAACGPLDKTLNAQSYSLVITNDKGERTFGYCRRVVPEGSNNCLPIAYCILSKHKSPRFYKKILIELESRHGISEKFRNNLLEALYYNKFPQPGETVKINLLENIGCGRNKENLCNIMEAGEEDDPAINKKKRNSTKTEDDSVSRNSLEDSIESSYVIVNDNGEYESLTKRKKEEADNIQFLDVCGENEIVLNVHQDPIYENSDLKDLHELPIEILKKIFASLLLERKVILISCLLSKLSSCVEALQTIIYPFTWPHSFIPVLPESLWEFVEAPTPLICGILSVEVLNRHSIEHGIVVDLDEKFIVKEMGDEDSVLCSTMLKPWRKQIEVAKNIPVEDESYSFYLTDAYIHLFAVPLKNYKDYIVNGNFQKEAFIRSARKKSVRRFLKWFTESSMFLAFVDTVITNSQDFSGFDKKIALYSDQTGLEKIFKF